MAAQEHHVDVVSYLLANGASQDITTEVRVYCVSVMAVYSFYFTEAAHRHQRKIGQMTQKKDKKTIEQLKC